MSLQRTNSSQRVSLDRAASRGLLGSHHSADLGRASRLQGAGSRLLEQSYCELLLPPASLSDTDRVRGEAKRRTCILHGYGGIGSAAGA